MAQKTRAEIKAYFNTGDKPTESNFSDTFESTIFPEDITGASAKTTPVDADTLPLNDSAASGVLKKITWANMKAALKTYFDTLYSAAETVASIGTLISGSTAKSTPVDADLFPISDSAASNVIKKVSGTNLKAYLKTYFDTLYSTGTTTITINDQTASYTLVLADAGKLVRQNVTSANNLTVPLNSSVAFPTGTQIAISNTGAGQVTIVATGGVTINSASGALKLRVQYSAATLIKTATDTWLLTGDITT